MKMTKKIPLAQCLLLCISSLLHGASSLPNSRPASPEPTEILQQRLTTLFDKARQFQNESALTTLAKDASTYTEPAAVGLAALGATQLLPAVGQQGFRSIGGISAEAQELARSGFVHSALSWVKHNITQAITGSIEYAKEHPYYVAGGCAVAAAGIFTYHKIRILKEEKTAVPAAIEALNKAHNLITDLKPEQCSGQDITDIDHALNASSAATLPLTHAPSLANAHQVIEDTAVKKLEKLAAYPSTSTVNPEIIQTAHLVLANRHHNPIHALQKHGVTGSLKNLLGLKKRTVTSL